MENKAMHRNGKSIRAIAKETDLHRKTGNKHLAGDEFPRYNKIQRRESILAPYFQTIQDYLEEDVGDSKKGIKSGIDGVGGIRL